MKDFDKHFIDFQGEKDVDHVPRRIDTDTEVDAKYATIPYIEVVSMEITYQLQHRQIRLKMKVNGHEIKDYSNVHFSRARMDNRTLSRKQAIECYEYLATLDECDFYGNGNFFTVSEKWQQIHRVVPCTVGAWSYDNVIKQRRNKIRINRDKALKK